jgi:L-lactate dehydrogenase
MKVGIVGSGLVGSTAAYAMVLQGVGEEIVLIDKNIARARAEADDILYAVPFAHPLRVRGGNYADLAGCQVVVVTAGVTQGPGETRSELLQKNAAILRELLPEVLRFAADSVLVVTTKPVDVMTHLTARMAATAGIPAGRILGSGTILDTARFRTLLAAHCEVDTRHVHAYVVGQHGESRVLTWSLATIAGVPLDEFTRLRGIELDVGVRTSIDGRVRRAVYAIVAGKGATYYGIAAALARIVGAILHDQRAVLTVCSPLPEFLGVPDVTLSLPHLVGGGGVLATFPLPLDSEETERLRGSARVVKQAIEELEAAVPA